MLVSNAGMRNRFIRSCLLVATLALAFAGCASRQGTMEARYEQSLQRWQGATRAQLEAAWGKPMLVQNFLNEVTLTWTVNDDMHPSQPMAAYSNMGMSAPTISVPTIAPAVPMRCTTRFTLRNDVVVGWKFDGLACGAPG